MSKPTLLKIVQDILSDMDSDEVNSIDDTFEAAQVAQIIVATYRDMMSSRNWSHQKKITVFDSSGSSLLPVVLPVGEKTKQVESVKYNKMGVSDTRKNYEDVDYVSPDDFLRISNSRDSSSDDVMVMKYNGVELLIQKNKAPSYYTSFNETEVLFDSYDSEVDDTIQSSKTQLIAYFSSDLVLDDGSVPDLPSEAFSALINEAKSRCMLSLKQTSDDLAIREARKQNSWLSGREWTINGGIKYDSYGRKGAKTARDKTFGRK